MEEESQEGERQTETKRKEGGTFTELMAGSTLFLFNPVNISAVTNVPFV